MHLVGRLTASHFWSIMITAGYAGVFCESGFNKRLSTSWIGRTTIIHRLSKCWIARIGTTALVIDCGEMIEVARHLTATGAAMPLGNSYLRRAVSTAYYALFHTMLGAAADRFVGTAAKASAGYALLYRGYDHGQMRRLFEDLSKSTLKATLRSALNRNALSPELRQVSTEFVALQDLRHLADYDPVTGFNASDVSDIIDATEEAIGVFAQADAEEKSDLLALLLVGARK